MIYGFEAAFFSCYFSKRLPSVCGLVQLLFAVVDFFHLRFALVNPGPFCASVVDLLFQVSQRRSLSLYIYREKENRSCCWRLNRRAAFAPSSPHRPDWPRSLFSNRKSFLRNRDRSGLRLARPSFSSSPPSPGHQHVVVDVAA